MRGFFILLIMKIGLVDSGIGIIPFIKSIKKLNKKNEYYLFFDNTFFPYGNKTEIELLNRIRFIFDFYTSIKIDELLICCNTLSYIYLKYKPNSNFKVRTILEININKNLPLLTTTFLSDKLKTIDGSSLATYITNNNVKSIINLIKKIKEDEFVLSCTHYPLIKEIFSLYEKKVYSFEDELIENLPIGIDMKFYILRKDLSLIRHYFPKLSISFID